MGHARTVVIKSFSLPPDVYSAMEAKAAQLGVNQSALVTELVRRGLKKAALTVAKRPHLAHRRRILLSDADLTPKDEYLESEWYGAKRRYLFDLLEVGEQLRVYYKDDEEPRTCYLRTKTSWHCRTRTDEHVRNWVLAFQVRSQYLLVERVR